MWTRLRRTFDEWRRRGVVAVAALYVVAAWVVLQAAALAFPGWDIPDAAIRWVWIGAIVLFPVALVVGWRYDITADGVRRTAAPGVSRGLSRGDLAILGLLGVAAVAVLSGVTLRVLEMRQPGGPAPAPEAPENSIAVLPFVDMSGEDGNEYFSDGITEQLLNELSRIRGLHVAARTSSFHYKNRTEPMSEIGRALGVRTLLEGSVRKAGGTVRVTAQLIDARSGYHLWSEIWDRELTDIFAVQDEIARRIATTLRVRLQSEGLAAIDRGGTLSAQAYDLYLKAMAERHETDRDAVLRSNALLGEALGIDPDFALALDALAYGYLLLAFEGRIDRETALADARTLLARALDEEPQLEQAHASLGLLHSMKGDFEEANARYERALDINPNDCGGQVNYGLSLVHQSRLKDASAAYFRALALDPLNANLTYNLAALLMLQGAFEQGLEFMRRASEIQPDNAGILAGLTYWMTQYGGLADAVTHGRETYSRYPDHARNVAALVEAYTLLGFAEEAEALLDEAEATLPGNDIVAGSRADYVMSGGDFEAASAAALARFQDLDLKPGDALDYSARQAVLQYGWSLLLAGRNVEAARTLYWASGGEERFDAITYDHMRVLKLLALAWQRTGREADAQALVDRCLELARGARRNGWGTPVLSVRLAEVHLLDGNVDAAMTELGIAVDKGFRDVGWLEHGIFWRHVQDDPRLEAEERRMLDAIERERERLRVNPQAERWPDREFRESVTAAG